MIKFIRQHRDEATAVGLVCLAWLCLVSMALVRLAGPAPTAKHLPPPAVKHATPPWLLTPTPAEMPEPSHELLGSYEFLGNMLLLTDAYDQAGQEPRVCRLAGIQVPKVPLIDEVSKAWCVAWTQLGIGFLGDPMADEPIIEIYGDCLSSNRLTTFLLHNNLAAEYDGRQRRQWTPQQLAQIEAQARQVLGQLQPDLSPIKTQDASPSTAVAIPAEGASHVRIPTRSVQGHSR